MPRRPDHRHTERHRRHAAAASTQFGHAESARRVPRHADRVTERDGPAVHVDLGFVDAEIVQRGEATAANASLISKVQTLDVGSAFFAA